MLGAEHSFTSRLIQIMSELDCLIRLKNFMMMTYKEEFWDKRNDQWILSNIKTKKTELDNGPKAGSIDGKHKNMKATMLFSSTPINGPKH